MFFKTFSHLGRNKTANELTAKRKDLNAMKRMKRTLSLTRARTQTQKNYKWKWRMTPFSIITNDRCHSGWNNPTLAASSSRLASLFVWYHRFFVFCDFVFFHHQAFAWWEVNLRCDVFIVSSNGDTPNQWIFK